VRVQAVCPAREQPPLLPQRARAHTHACASAPLRAAAAALGPALTRGASCCANLCQVAQPAEALLELVQLPSISNQDRALAL
jgi:hypothetical protein